MAWKAHEQWTSMFSPIINFCGLAPIDHWNNYDYTNGLPFTRRLQYVENQLCPQSKTGLPVALLQNFMHRFPEGKPPIDLEAIHVIVWQKGFSCCLYCWFSFRSFGTAANNNKPVSYSFVTWYYGNTSYINIKVLWNLIPQNTDNFSWQPAAEQTFCYFILLIILLYYFITGFKAGDYKKII